MLVDVGYQLIVWLIIKTRGRNKVGFGPIALWSWWGPIKYLDQGPCMALENVGSFDTRCIKCSRKTKSSHENKIEGPQFFNTSGLNDPLNFWLISTPDIRYLYPCLTLLLTVVPVWIVQSYYLYLIAIALRVVYNHRCTREIPEPVSFLSWGMAQIGVFEFFPIIKITVVHQVRISLASTVVWAWR